LERFMHRETGDLAPIEAADSIKTPSYSHSIHGDAGQVTPPAPVAEMHSSPEGQVTWRSSIAVWAALFGLVLIGIALMLGGKEAGRFLGIGTQFAPFALLAALAFGGLKNSASRLFAYLWLALLALGVLLLSLGFTAMAYVKNWNLLLELLRDRTLIDRVGIDQLIKPGLLPALQWAFLLMVVVGVMSGLMLVRGVRVWLSRIISIDPDNFVHKIALCILMAITFSQLVPLIVLGGRAPLLEAISAPGYEQFGTEIRPLDLFYQLVWYIPTAIVAAGWPVARRFGAALHRLGMVRPTRNQVGGAIIAGIGLAIVATFVLDPAIGWLWEAFGWPRINMAAFGNILTGIVNPVGAALIGITAGIGEEMAVRGLLQPRIGLVAANFVFTAFHAAQYGPDALLSVFLIGLVLGVIRARSNTTTSAIVHGVYDFVLVMAAVVVSQ
jgi:hypothetical protein